MSPSLFFKIPPDLAMRECLARSIPNTWSHMSGKLEAPEELIKSGLVVANTGFTIQRFRRIEPTIVGRPIPDSSGTREDADFVAIMTQGKLPGFISFHEAGFEKSIITLQVAIEIAAAFLRKGYGGRLSFVKGYIDRESFTETAGCNMQFQPWKPPYIDGEGPGMQPPRIKITWLNPGDELAHVTSIIDVCRTLNLREYNPLAMA